MNTQEISFPVLPQYFPVAQSVEEVGTPVGFWSFRMGAVHLCWCWLSITGESHHIIWAAAEAPLQRTEETYCVQLEQP